MTKKGLFSTESKPFFYLPQTNLIMTDDLINPNDIVYVVYNNQILKGEVISVTLERTPEHQIIKYRVADVGDVKVFGYQGLYIDSSEVHETLQDCLSYLERKHIETYPCTPSS